MSLWLDLADLTDAEYLLALRNDPVTRAMSRTTTEIPKAVHLQWLVDVLRSTKHRLYVVKNDDAPVGSCRLDFNAFDVELSLTVDPAWRGKGFGRQIIQLLVESARKRSTLPLTAEILVTNLPSLLSFLREGFIPQDILNDQRLITSSLEPGRRWLWVRRETT